MERNKTDHEWQYPTCTSGRQNSYSSKEGKNMDKDKFQEEQWYSVKRFADTMGVSQSLVRKLIKKKTIPYVRLGERRIVIPPSAIER